MFGGHIENDTNRKEGIRVAQAPSNLPLVVYLDRFQSFHVIIVDNQQIQNVEYEKHPF